jgi:putative ABC transport system permease protein
MTGLVLRSLRFHKGGFLASFVALFFGASIVIACGGLLETGILSQAAPQRLAGAPIVVTGDQSYPGQNKVFQERVRLNSDDVAKIASVPGVTAAVPDVSFPVSLVGPGGVPGANATGHNWGSSRLGSYTVSGGTAPELSGQVALDARLAAAADTKPGQQIVLDIRGTTRSYAVTGLVSGPGDAGTVFFSDTGAAALVAQPGEVDSIGVLTAAGTDSAQVRTKIKAVLHGQQASVLTGDQRGRAEFPKVVTDSKTLISMSAVFGGLAALVTVFVVAGTLGLSIQQRHREMALLRAIGSTPAQVRRMVLAETTVVAVFATALACWPGPPLGARLLGAFVRADVVPSQLIYRTGWVPMVAGAAIAVLTALGAAFIAARGASRIRPTEALAEAAAPHRWFSWVRLLFALLCLGGGTVLAWVTATMMSGANAGSTATPAAMLWAAGFGLLGPGLTRLITAVLRWPLRAFTGFAGHLALLNARARSIRLAGAVMPVMLATGLAISLIYLQTTQNVGAGRAFQDNLRADLVVTSSTGGLPLSVVETVARQPGVAASSADVPSSGFLQPTEAQLSSYDGKGAQPKGKAVQIQGVSAQGIGATTSIRALSGSLTDLSGNTVVLPESLASGDGYKIGDRVPMRLGDGTDASPTLVATTGEQRGYAAVLLPASVVVAHTTQGLVPQVLVKAAAGTDLGKLTRDLAALDSSQPGLRVTERAAVLDAQQTENDTQTWVAYLLVAMVIGYAVIALINTLVLATAERRREFTLQRLVGATRSQVMRMMTVEALLTALAGIFLGLLVAAATLVPLSMAVLGSPFPAGPPWISVVVVGSAFALTLLTTLLSAGMTLRGSLTTAVGTRE